MSNELWFPKKFEFPNGIKSRSILYQGTNWEIHETDSGCRALVSKKELASRWVDCGLLTVNVLEQFKFGSNDYYLFVSSDEYTLAPIIGADILIKKVDALSFAISLRDSRKIDKHSSFHDAIFVEKLSRLLPTWTLTQPKSDDVVLGNWMTGGVNVSTNSKRRLYSLMNWMPDDQIEEIISVADLSSDDMDSVVANDSATNGSDRYSNSNYKKDDKINQENTISQVDRFELPGRATLENFFNEHVVDIVRNADRYKKLGINFPSAIVLYGPPGCGKTYAVEKLIECLGWPSYSINSNSIGSPYIHDTGKKISELFDKAIDDSPSVLIIDEMEAFLSDRNLSGSSGIHHVEEVAEFLRRIPDAISHKVLVVAMTNLIELIDPAILRRGRFDHVISVDMPSKDELEDVMKSLLKDLPTCREISLSKCLNTLIGRPISDASFTIREAARLAAKNGKSCIDQESIDNALNSVKELKSSKGSEKHIGF